MLIRIRCIEDVHSDNLQEIPDTLRRIQTAHGWLRVMARQRFSDFLQR